MPGLIKVIVLIVVAYLLYRYVWLRIKKIQQARLQAPPSNQISAVDMVKCAHCQAHIPNTEAVKLGQEHYCKEHAPRGC